MKTAVKNIASIQTGLFAKPAAKGEVLYLQARHIKENGELENNLFPRLGYDPGTEKHLLSPGDVLLVSKGTRNTAAVFQQQDYPAVASTSFFVIRCKEKTIQPDFLAWLLNSEKVQQTLKEQAIGTAIVSISKSVLENLVIPLPDLKTQQAVLTIAGLRNKEKSIKQQIEALREKQIQQQISKAIK
ncbi:MAG: restriction endonuclease subunit S [Chitinophagaceae bacterium]|nr:restriction endonuclease subunit S [Chitinophagaceae bacterium]